MTAPTPAANPPAVRSKVSELAARIELDISLGTLTSGMWLKQVDLEASYKCPRIDLREALDRLSEKGLVRLESNRGYRVAEIDELRLSQILRVRAVLEIEAAREIVANFPDEALPELHELAMSFAHSVDSGTVVEQEEANRRFHCELLRYCTNAELVHFIFELRNRAPLSMNRRKNTNTRLQNSAREHFEMIECLNTRNLVRYREIIRHHVLGELSREDQTGVA